MSNDVSRRVSIFANVNDTAVKHIEQIGKMLALNN